MIKLSLIGVCARDNMRKVWTFLIAIILTITVIPLIIDIAPSVASEIIWYVDDILGGSPSEDFTTIQEAVDAAQPGDTVFVYAGKYNEDVTITKTINLTGEERDTTIINSTDKMGIYVTNADFVNISGFTVVNGSWAGIRLMPSNNSLIENCRVEMNNYGIQIIDSNNTLVKDNIVINNHDYAGIYLYNSDNILIENNTILKNSIGIWIRDNSDYNRVIFNNVSLNNDGIHLGGQSHYNTIANNFIDSNKVGNPSAHGIFLFYSTNNVINDNIISNNQFGITMRYIDTSYRNQIVNCTIFNSTAYDIEIKDTSFGSILNTTFNKSLVHFDDTMVTSNLIVQWYLHINVTDYLGNPVLNANVKLEDNRNGSYNESFTTDLNGYLRWLPVTEYIEQDSDGNSIGEYTYYTPHRIIAWNNTLVGYAYAIMNKSKTINIVLYDGTLLDLEPGWNLISLSRIQSNTNVVTVLQSIEERYDAVQYYNITDNNDHWKHYHISKPPYMNDLEKLNHTMGFWIHIIDSEGTTLVTLGDELTSDQNILLHPGWNLVGYPSKSNKTRNIALDNINFGDDVDSIWTYNASMQKWIELDESTDHFEIGKGYWLHSKVTKVWNVPL
jgi:parallel beta-helix repeat protein